METQQRQEALNHYQTYFIENINGKIKGQVLGRDNLYFDPTTGRYWLSNWNVWEDKETCIAPVEKTEQGWVAGDFYPDPYSDEDCHLFIESMTLVPPSKK